MCVFNCSLPFAAMLGDFSDPAVAVWSSSTFQMLSSESVLGPIHDAAFSPSVASQLACVGSQGVYFGLFDSHGQDGDLSVSNLPGHCFDRITVGSSLA